MPRLFAKPVGNFKSSHGPALRAAGAVVLLGILAFTASGCLAGGSETETGSRAAKNSIVGPDENGNGIRDDVDDYISRKYDGEREQAVRQFAKAMTKELVRGERGNEEAILEAVRESFDAIECIHHKIEDAQTASEAVLETRAQILNTYRRSEVDEKVSGIAGGHVFERVGDEEKVCK